MNKILLTLMFFIISINSFSQTILKGKIDGELYLKFKDEVPIFWDTEADTIMISQFSYLKRFQKDFGIYSIENSFGFARSSTLRRILKIKFSEISKINEFLSKLSLNPEIEYAESININYTHIVPNDPSYSTQWHLTHINADQAWNITTGSSSIDVAVVDDAVQTTHSDLSCNIASSWDITNNTGSAMPPTSSYAHGTHVAGIVAACTNNNVGVSSIGWNTDIIAVKAANGSLTPNGQIGISHGYEGITWAAQNGAEIINCSWGAWSGAGATYSQVAQTAINDAWNNYGCIIVAAAGNNNSNLVSYPAAYNNVIAVANSTNTDSRYTGSYGSNYGTWVDVTAPGTDIPSTYINNGYATLTGTSMASPLVAGLLALVWSANPSASRQDVIDCVLNTAVPLTWQGGSGRIDAYAAVSCMNSGSSAPPNDNCATAQNLTVYGQFCGTATNGTVQNATASSISYPTSCNGFATSSALDVWYTFTANSTEHDITVDPNGTTIGNNAYLDAQIALYNGNPCTNGIGTFVGCYDEPCSPNGGGCTTVYQATGLIPGNTYYVRVYDFGAAAVQPSNAGFTICITTPNGGGSGHDFYMDNLVLSASSFAPGDPITIDCEQWTTDPNGTAESVDMEYRLQDMNGNLITVLGSDNSGIGGGDDFDGESISTTIPTGIANGNYQICVLANTNGVTESNYNNNTQCQTINVTSGTGGGGHDFYPNNTTINNTSFVPNDLIELVTETSTSNPSGTTAVIESIAELYDNNGNFVMQIDISQGCTIGNGDPFDTQYFTDYIPNIPTGNYTACVNVNYNNAVAESNTGNNTYCFSIYVNNTTNNNYTITTTSNPVNGGTTTGGGTYNSGTTATISAFANIGWVFDRWTENGNIISYATSHSFNVYSNRNFVAEFVPTTQLPNLTNLYDNSYNSGNTFVFDFAIQNNGNIGAGPFDVYYLASDGVNSYFIGTPTTVPWINANSSYLIAQPVNLCSVLPSNINYDFYYWIDYNNNVTETDENDNVNYSMSYYLTCATPLPNLMIASDNSFLNGNQVNFSFIVQNNGNASSSGFWVDYFVEDINGNLYNLGAGDYVSSLSPANSWGLSRTFDFCALGMPNGAYNVGYVIDYVSGSATGNIVESNENDNGLTIAYSYPFSCSVVAYPVTFQVDMSQSIVSANGVHIAGDFQSEAGFGWDWDPGITQLLDPDLDGVYSITVYLPAGNYEYKFVNGNAWGTEESVPTLCNVGGNRGMQNNVGLTLPAVCFGDCYACINNTYTITTSQNPINGGTTIGGGNYSSGQNVTVTATPQTGWQFVDWQENGATVTTNSQYSFTVNGNRSLVANFTQIYYWISIVAVPSNGGTTTWSGSQPSGQTMTVTATPQTGWQFVDWQENGITVSTNSQYSFTVTGDRNLVANFTQSSQTYTINGIPNPSNAGVVYGSGNYIGGGNANLIATANGGWLFLNWSDGSTIVSTNTNYSFTVTGTKTLIANFVPSVGIEQPSSTSNVLVYPNPTQGIFTIEWKNMIAHTINIEVINGIGQNIHSEKAASGTQKLIIDLQNVAKGIYLVRIGDEVAKLIVE